MDKVFSLNKPILILIVGIAGSGKTNLALALSKKIINSSYISKDLFQSSFTEDRQDENYEYIMEPTIKFLLSFCNTQLQIGKSPIVDAPYTINKWREGKYTDIAPYYKEIAEKNNTFLIVFRCKTANLEELKNRLINRGYPRDKWKLENWNKFLEREPMEVYINHNYVFDILTNKPIEACVDDAINYIRSVVK